MLYRVVAACAVFAGCVFTQRIMADEVSDSVKILQAVQPGGKGTAAARDAVNVLIRNSQTALLPVLKGFHDSSPLAVNWLRNAAEEIVSVELGSGRKLPVNSLESFVRDQTQSPVARRLTFEILRSQDPSVDERMIPEMLLDPGPEFRRDAVARLIDEASKASDGAVAIPLYRKAMSGAVHEDQVKQIAEALRKSGEEVDIQRHFGFVSTWMIVGPFDNKEEKGFAVAYTPETEAAQGKALDASTEYDGQSGKVQWKPLATSDDFGVIDIARQIENYKGSVMYASTTWTSEKAQQAEIRLGTPNAWKLWVNGTLTFEREEYHRSSAMDQYRVPVSLRAGPNILLLKICQNEQTQDWAQRYQFQLRICDSTGSGILPGTTTAQTESQNGDKR